jgi:phage-related protein
LSFYAKSFSYDGQSSEMYNLSIANLDDGSSTVSSPGSGKISIIDQFIYRRISPFFYGVHFDSRLSFPVSFFSPDEIDSVSLSYAQQWLFSSLSYKPLAIIQPDLDDILAYCIFTDPQIIRAGNIIYGLSATCECSSQFFYTYPKSVSYAYTSPPYQSPITFFNNSHIQNYLYPSIIFLMNSTGGTLNIINTSDTYRSFMFAGLQPNEVISVNNDLGIISSSTGALRLSNFNKNFLRFVPGLNQLLVSGNVSTIQLTYQFIRRFGG